MCKGFLRALRIVLPDCMDLYARTNLNTDACTNLHHLDCTRVHQLGCTRQGAPRGWRTSNWPAGCPQAISHPLRPVRLTIPLPMTAPCCTLQVCSPNQVHNQTNQVHIVHSQTKQVTWSRCTMNHLATCANCGKLTCKTGVSKSRYFGISIPIKYSNFSRFYKKMGPFYKKFRCDKFGN